MKGQLYSQLEAKPSKSLEEKETKGRAERERTRCTTERGSSNGAAAHRPVEHPPKKSDLLINLDWHE